MKIVSRFLSSAFFVILLLNQCSISVFAQKQISFTITKVPEYTPENDTLYLSTSLNNWQLKQPNMRFTKRSNGTFFLAISVSDDDNFEYKINRGVWDKVEGNKLGEYAANRNFVNSSDVHDIELEILSWQDLHKDYLPSVDIYVHSIPSNTPKDAKLYITGSFNDWHQAEPSSELVKQEDGTYHGAIMAGLRNFEYKITRGSWETVEARWDGGLKSNRVFKAIPGQKTDIHIDVAAWEDVSTGAYWKMLLFLFFSIQALQLVALIRYFKFSKLLLILTSMIAIGFFLRFGYNNQGLFPIFPYGYLLPACAFSFIGPWMFNWLVNKYHDSSYQPIVVYKSFSFGIPFLSFLILITLVNLPFLDLRVLAVHEHLDIYFITLYSFALVLNFIFGIKSQKHINRSGDIVPNWVNKLFVTLQINWYFSLIIALFMSFAYYLQADIMMITEWAENLFWIGLGLSIIYIEWGIILGNAKTVSKLKSNEKKHVLEKDSWSTLKKQLNELMNEKKLYFNPQLTLSDLAKELGTNNYYVSKVLNEGIGKNFSDYINSFRINEFIEEVKKEPKNKNYLSLAFKVGFNSKSVFNRAFKKNTGVTPSQYFSELN